MSNGQLETIQTASLVREFCDSVMKGEIDIYNEFSLQHELGFWLRQRINGCKVQFEKNVSYFFGAGGKFTKREIDLTIFDDQVRHLAIELKFPRNGQYPESMFSFCKDIAFVEELKKAGFKNAALLIFAEDRNFYEGSGTGIYGFFRAGQELCGTIRKPTGKRDEEVVIEASYSVRWLPLSGTLKYALIEAADG